MALTFLRPAGASQKISRGPASNRARTWDALHFFSAGAASFARGLNDTPKMVALLLVTNAYHLRWGLLAVAVMIAVGALLDAERVAETLGKKVTDMNPGQGFAANLATAILVTTASFHSLPVSTTHVSVGALLGIGITTRQAHWRKVGGDSAGLADHAAVRGLARGTGVFGHEVR